MTILSQKDLFFDNFPERTSINSEEKIKIRNYLVNPVSSGLWNLNSEWIECNGISKSIWENFLHETNNKESITFKSGKRERTITLSESFKKNTENAIFTKLTFIFSLLDFITREENGLPSRNDEDEFIHLILDLIDLEDIKQKYRDAINLFKSEIWHKNFIPSIGLMEPFRIKSGLIFLSKAPTDVGYFSALSFDKPPLDSINNLFKLLDKTENSIFLPIFSPEEEVFEPYYNFLSIAHENITPQKHIYPFLVKATKNFFEENYTDSVSSIGLASEDILTQIYETIYREQLTKGLTLGQLSDEINTKANAVLKKKDNNPPDFSKIYNSISDASKKQDDTFNDLINITRNILSKVIENNNYLTDKIDKIGKPERKLSIWPEKIGHHINELIRYRNAASHKSRIPIGHLECKRAAHSLIYLIDWWNNEKKIINWESSKESILRDCLQRNNSNPPLI